MLTYSFSNIGSCSLYEHLYKLIKQDILTGVLPAGYKLPSKRSFAKNLNISTITIENAYAQLMAEGYIYSIPKKGYFVSEISENSYDDDSILSSEHINKTDIRHKNDYIAHGIPKTGCGNNDLSVFGQDNGTFSKDISLSSNHTSPDTFPFTIWAKLMRETLSDNRDKLMMVSPSMGLYELRAAIAAHLKAFRGMNVQPEQIVIGAGTEYLYNIIIQLLGRQRVYAVEDPGYKKISQIYESNQVKCQYIPMDSNGINVDKLEESGADIIHLSPSHHFPTGTVTPISKRYELLSWAAKATLNNRYIIEDDYDSEFRLMGKPIPSLQSIDVMERVIYMNSFSKSLTSTIRISYMVLPPHLMERYNQTLSFYSCTVSNFEQYTLARFINEGYFEKHINRMRNYYRNLRDIFIDSIKTSSLSQFCTILEADSGLHFLLKLDTSLSDSALKQTLKKENIIISCVSDYYHNPADAQEHVIIANYSGLVESNIHTIVAALSKTVG